MNDGGGRFWVGIGFRIWVFMCDEMLGDVGIEERDMEFVRIRR